MSNAIAWKTNFDNKHMIYAAARDSLMKEQMQVEIRSRRLLAQMQGIVYDDGRIGAGSDQAENDDLVTAFVLAHYVWYQRLRDPLAAQGKTWAAVHEPPDRDPARTLSEAYSNHMKWSWEKQTQRQERF